MLINLGESIQAEDIGALLSSVDKDGDGQINYEEFSAVLLEQASCTKEEDHGARSRTPPP